MVANPDAPISSRSADGAVVYRASAAGGCPRALVAARLGYEAKPPPAKFTNPEGTGYFDEGKDLEADIIAMLVEQGFQVFNEQKEVLLRISELNPELWEQPTIIVGHIDGECVPPASLYPVASEFEHLLEIKKLRGDNFRRFKDRGLDEFPVYKFQVSCYMFAMERADLCFVVFNPENNELLVTLYERPPLELWQLQAHFLQIEEFIRTGEPVGMMACSNNYPCPYYYLHDEKPSLPQSLAVRARVYSALRASRDKTQEKMDEIRDLMLTELKEPGSYKSGDVTVTVIDGRSYVDIEKIRALLVDAGVDISDYETKSEKKSVRVNVKSKDAASS